MTQIQFHRIAFTMFVVLTAIGFCSTSCSQEPDYPKVVAEAIGLIDVFVDEEGPLKHVLVYKYANGATKQQVGQISVCIHEGLPVATVKNGPTVSRSKERPNSNDVRVDHVINSVTDRKIECRYGGKVMCSLPSSGIEFMTLEKYPAPDESAARRLSHAKLIAKDFSAKIDQIGADFADTGSELRLLTTPIYRYGSKDFNEIGIVDGFFFLFVLDSGSPVVNLQLRAVRNTDEIRWQYAVSRGSVGGQSVEFQGRKIFDAPRISDRDQRRSLFRIYDPR